MEEQRDIASSTAPMYYLTLLLGLASYVCTGLFGSRRFVKGRFYVVYHVGAALVHTAIVGGAFYLKVLYRDMSLFDSKLVMFEMCTGLFITVVVLISHQVFKSGVLKTMKEMYEMDQRFSAFGIHVEYDVVYKRCLAVAAFLLACALWYAFVTTMAMHLYEPYYWLLFFLQYLVSMTMKSQFCVLNIMLKYRFMALDGKLKEVIDATRDEPAKPSKIIMVGAASPAIGPMSPLAAKVVTLSEFHSKLYNLSLRVNYFYSVQILLITGKYFVEITGTLYYNLQIFYKQDNQQTYNLYAFSYLVWAFMNAADLLMLVYICDSMCAAANNSKLTLHKINLNSKDIELKKEVTAFSLQLLHNDLVLTAAGFFNIDFTLVFNIIGGVTTYLVIFIQFDMTDTTKSSTELVDFNSTTMTELALYSHDYLNETLL